MSAYEEILDFITSAPTLEQIVNFDLSAEAIERVRELEDKEDLETLTRAEASELRDFRRAAEFMAQLMIRARRRLGMAT